MFPQKFGLFWGKKNDFRVKNRFLEFFALFQQKNISAVFYIENKIFSKKPRKWTKKILKSLRIYCHCGFTGGSNGIIIRILVVSTTV